MEPSFRSRSCEPPKKRRRVLVTAAIRDISVRNQRRGELRERARPRTGALLNAIPDLVRSGRDGVNSWPTMRLIQVCSLCPRRPSSIETGGSYPSPSRINSWKALLADALDSGGDPGGEVLASHGVGGQETSRGPGVGSPLRGHRHRHPAGHHREEAARGAAPAVAEDGGDRAARRRRRARFQQPADRHHRLRASCSPASSARDPASRRDVDEIRTRPSARRGLTRQLLAFSRQQVLAADGCSTSTQRRRATCEQHAARRLHRRGHRRS